MILKYLDPRRHYSAIQNSIEDFSNYRKYKQVISDLKKTGKLEVIGFSYDSDSNLYLGIDLNPELLMYSETSQESVELKLVSEKVGKYTDFLTKEGILDSVKLDYDRIKTETYYGYILQISYDFKKHNRRSLIQALSYFFGIFALLSSLILLA